MVLGDKEGKGYQVIEEGVDAKERKTKEREEREKTRREERREAHFLARARAVIRHTTA